MLGQAPLDVERIRFGHERSIDDSRLGMARSRGATSGPLSVKAGPKGDGLRKEIGAGQYPGIIKTTLDGFDERDYPESIGGALGGPVTAFQYDWNMLPIGQQL
jgi:hypothetical protein